MVARGTQPTDGRPMALRGGPSTGTGPPPPPHLRGRRAVGELAVSARQGYDGISAKHGPPVSK
eukprot:99041-Prorocentrum_minimum.AAC.1